MGNSSWAYAELIANSDIDLMIYSSTADPILGPPTTEAGVISVMEDLVRLSPKNGKKIENEFEATQKDVWFVDNKFDRNPAGYAKCVSTGTDRRFCYTVVRNAGHEMPGYQPRASYDMLDRFLKREHGVLTEIALSLVAHSVVVLAHSLVVRCPAVTVALQQRCLKNRHLIMTGCCSLLLSSIVSFQISTSIIYCSFCFKCPTSSRERFRE